MQVYSVAMQTSLGIKRGVLKMNVAAAEVTGSLRILMHDEQIHGTMGSGGQLHLEGNMTSLLRSSRFTADGIVDGEELRLSLASEHSVFQMTGKRIEEGRNG